MVGIDFGFLTIDWFGAFFSLMALGEFLMLCVCVKEKGSRAKVRLLD